MPSSTRTQLLLACSTCLLIGWLIGQNGTPSSQAKQATAMVEAPTFPMAARLGANLYLQTSAEYRAGTLQTYQMAAQQLEALLKTTREHRETLPPAVVMDLDETVFDNSAFQTFLYQHQFEYSDEQWMNHEQHPQDVTLVPGAKAFIDQATKLGATVVYLSNRSDRHRQSTLEALRQLDVAGSGIELRLLLKPSGTTSDKTERRATVSAKYDVVMYVGDNLRDFSDDYAAPKLPADATPEDFAKAIATRAKLVDRDAKHWGHDWIVLPNPVYGEWEKLIGPDPVKLFHPTSMTAPK